MATIKLNELGIKVIKDRQFRYISPTFGELTDNLQQPHKNVLMSISLTNVPALHGSLPQIQEQLELERKPNIGGTRMTGLTLKLTELQKVVGLEQITSLQDETDTAAIMEVLGAIGEKVAEIQELLVQVQGEKETAEKVAEEAEQQLETIRKADAEKEKERFFEKLVKEEKIDMSELEMWKEHYDSNKDFTIKMLSNRTGKITQLSSANTNNVSLTQKLDEDDIQALQNMGIDRNDTEKVKEYLAAQKNY